MNDFAPYPPLPEQPPTGSVAPQKRGGNGGKTVLIVLAILAGIGVLCCGAGGIVTYTFFSFGEQVLVEDIRSQLQDDPTIKNELGGIESMELNWAASMMHDDEETMVYEVQGSLGKGRLEVRSITNGDQEVIEAAILRISDGRALELDIATDGQ
ncbi:hypothetical protein SH139x_002863 [Planctomycetaceae bacterium SH139]